MGLLSKYYKKKGLPFPNFFIGGLGGKYSNEILLGDEMGMTQFKIKNMRIDSNDDISFYTSFNVDMPNHAFRNENDLTYFYDVDGILDEIPISCFEQATSMTRIWLPNVKYLPGPSGWKTLEYTNIKGFVEMPNLDQSIGALQTMNFIFNHSKITHLKYPKLTFLGTQSITANLRYTHRNITTLKRLYLPNVIEIDGEDGYEVSNHNFYLIPNNCVCYLNSFLEDNRLAETFVRLSNVIPGDFITLNGLTYTATSGSTTATEFNCTSGNVQSAKNLSNSITMDTRVGTLGEIFTRHQYNANWILIRQSLSGSTGNATTYSVSNPSRLIVPVGNTFKYGGTVDRSVAYWISRGADIRYMTGSTTTFPNPVNDLSAINITSNSVDLIFTEPSGHIRPIEFYEVWINDGLNTGYTVWQNHLPHQEISGSTATVTELESDTEYTIKIKTADTLYYLSDFSNPIVIRTL